MAKPSKFIVIPHFIISPIVILPYMNASEFGPVPTGKVKARLHAKVAGTTR